MTALAATVPAPAGCSPLASASGSSSSLPLPRPSMLRSSSPEPDFIDFDGCSGLHDPDTEDEAECSRSALRAPLSAAPVPSLTVTSASPRRRPITDARLAPSHTAASPALRASARPSRSAINLLPMTPLGNSSHFHTTTNRPGMSAASRTSSSDALRKSVLRKASESPPKAQNAVQSRYPSSPPKQKLSRQLIKPQNPGLGPREFVINWSSGENRSVIGA